MQQPSPDDIIEAVNIANSLREKMGADTIDDLPPALPGDAGECLLARAFNFDCTVGSFRGKYTDKQRSLCLYTWGARFRPTEKVQADALAEAIWGKGTKASRFDNIYSNLTRWEVPIPDKIASIAQAFDSYKMDPKYYEEEYDQKAAEENIAV
jgi:hypothetical protein